MISVVIISKDEESLDKTVSDVGDQAGRLAEAAEIVVVDASNGRLDHIGGVTRPRYGGFSSNNLLECASLSPTSVTLAYGRRAARSSCSPTPVVVRRPIG